MRDLEQVRHSVDIERRVDDLARPEQSLHYQPVSLTKGWDGASDKAAQTLNLQAAPWSLPSGIQAVSVRLYYVAANNGDYGALEKNSGNGHMIVCRCPDGGEGNDDSGIVNCDGNGDIYFDTNNTTNTVSLYINGYFK